MKNLFLLLLTASIFACFTFSSCRQKQADVNAGKKEGTASRSAGSAIVFDATQPLPSFAQWKAGTKDVKANLYTDGHVEVKGDDSRSFYQFQSPFIEVPPNSQVVIHLPVELMQGKIGMGILNESEESWIVNPDGLPHPLVFSTGENHKIKIVIANQYNNETERQPSHFQVTPGSLCVHEIEEGQIPGSIKVEPNTFLELPPLKKWMQGTPRVEIRSMATDQIKVFGDDSISLYQLISPAIPILPDVTVSIHLPLRILQGHVGIGILDASTHTWIVSPAKADLPVVFQSGKTEQIEVVIANHNPPGIQHVKSIFLVSPGLFYMTETADDIPDFGALSKEPFQQTSLEEGNFFNLNPYLSRWQKKGNPAIKNMRKGVTIRSNTGGENGVSLFYQMNPQDSYNVKMDATVQEGQVLIRRTMNGGEPQFIQGSGSPIEFSVTNTQDMELYVYAKEAFAIRIQSIEITPYDNHTRTDNDFKTFLKIEIPTLTACLQNNRLRAAELLMNWVANHVNYSVNQRQDHSKIFLQFVELQPPSRIFFDGFQANRGGCNSTGIAIFFQKVLRLFDYQAFVIHFGDIQQSVLHTTVVLGRKHESSWEYYLFDPTFNFVYKYKSSQQPAPLQDVLDHFEQNNTDNLAIHFYPIPQRNYLFLRQQIPSVDSFLEKGTVSRVTVWGDYILVDDTVSAKAGNAWNTLMKKQLEQLHRPTDAFRGYLSLLEERVIVATAVGSSLDPDCMAGFQSILKQHNIPYGMPSTP